MRSLFSVLSTSLLFCSLANATPTDFEKFTQSIRQFAEAPAQSSGLSPETCSQLTSINQTLVATDKNQFTPQYLEDHGQPVIDDLFSARLAIRTRLREMIELHPMEPSCLQAIRSFFRISRFIEEYVAEHTLAGKSVSSRVFSDSKPSLMMNPSFEAPNLRSGDVLLSRGNAVVSAAIARIGDDDGQFSHIALIYVDDQTKQIYTIEAHIEIGVVVAPIEKYLTDGKVRAVIFRPQDPKLAHLAAKTMYDKISRASQSKKGNIPYDFGMDLSTDKEIFCSEVASLGYSLASQMLNQTPFDVPLFKTTITMKNRTFLKDIGVMVNETFAPVDIDVDPRFELVAEWRDLTKTRDARFLDAILSSMYEWMETKNYVFDNTFFDIMKSVTGWSARKTFLFSPLLKDKFPRNMKLSALNAMISLGDVGGDLLNIVKTANDNELRQTGLSLTHMQIKVMLEEIRRKDFELYKSLLPVKKQPLFHKRFHPKDNSILPNFI